jgi:hypothetical protein
MFCSKCGREIEAGAAFCTGCGTKVEAAKVETPVDQDVNTVDTVTTETKTDEMPNAFGEVCFDKPKKKFGVGKIILSAVAVVLASAILVSALMWDKVYGFAISTFASDEAYFEYVEGEAFLNYADTLAAVYGNYTSKIGNDIGADMNLKVSLSEDAHKLLQNYVAMDLSWLKSVGLDGKVNAGKDQISTALQLLVSDKPVADLSLIVDQAAGKAFAGLPGLSEKFISLDLGDISEEDVKKVLTDGKFAKVFPKESEIAEYLKKYIKIFIENMDEVEKSTETIAVNGIEQKVIKLELKISEETLAKAVKAILTEVKADKGIEKNIKDFANCFAEAGLVDEETAGEVYANFVEAVDEAIADIDESELGSEAIVTLVSYVDGDHKVVGRKLIVEDETLFEYKTATKGKKFATEAVAGEVKLSGNGSISGGLRNGEFTLFVDGNDMVMIRVTDFGKDKFEKDGFINGKFVIEPTVTALDNLDMDDAVVSAVKLLDLGVGLDIKTNNKGGALELSLISKDEALATINLSVNETDYSRAKLPNDDAQISAVNAMEYIQTIDFAKLCDNLEAAGVPKELVDYIRNNLG